MNSHILTKEEPIGIISFEKEFFSNIHFVVHKTYKPPVTFV